MRNGAINALTKLTPAAQRIRIARDGKLICFHREIGPSPIRKIAGVIIGTKTASKYGGPTEILPKSSASITSGYNVPNITLADATRSNKLLANSIDSRDNKSNLPPKPTFGARHANNNNESVTVTNRNPRTNIPLSGSVANACTEVKTPERTKNVPSKLSENVKIANKTVQLLKPPRFSVTASECISAVPANQGIKEAFSTGSQNHQPPQPSS